MYNYLKRSEIKDELYYRKLKNWFKVDISNIADKVFYFGLGALLLSGMYYFHTAVMNFLTLISY